MPDPIISIPWMDESMTVPDFSKVKVNGELAVDILAQRDRYHSALKSIASAAVSVLVETPSGEAPLMLAPWVAGVANDALRRGRPERGRPVG